MFFGRASRLDGLENCPNCGFVRSQTWRFLTGSGIHITYISACMHKKELHLTAIQMFLRLVNTTGQVRRLPDVWIESTHRAVSAVV